MHTFSIGYPISGGTLCAGQLYYRPAQNQMISVSDCSNPISESGNHE